MTKTHLNGSRILGQFRFSLNDLANKVSERISGKLFFSFNLPCVRTRSDDLLQLLGFSSSLLQWAMHFVDFGGNVNFLFGSVWNVAALMWYWYLWTTCRRLRNEKKNDGYFEPNWEFLFFSNFLFMSHWAEKSWNTLE